MSKSVYSKEYQALLVKVRKARHDAKLTQQQAARSLRKPQSFISKCELGERRLDPVELKALARIYGKPLDYFLA